MQPQGATWGGAEAFRADYCETNAVYKTLVDIRFRLLAFVPTASAIAVALLSRDGTTGGRPRDSSELALGIGVIGLLATLGVVMYEVRNSQLHDQAIHRLKHLERLLGFRPAVIARGPGGLFSERGGERLSVLGIAIWHDRALSVIYGTTIAAWTWLIYEAAKEVVDVPGPTAPDWLTWAAPAAAGTIVAWQVVRLSDHGRAGGPIYTLCDPDLAPDWETRWSDLRLVLEHAEAPRRRPWRARADRVRERVTAALAGDERRSKAVIELARGLGLVETARMALAFRARPGDLDLDARRPDARERRRRRYRRTERGTCLLDALRKGDVDRRRRVLLAGLRDGVIGIEDLCLSQGSLDVAERDLRARYGDNAPWCSEREIAARVVWLRQAGVKLRP